MKLGVMQPYFFPYIGYFELINRCDEWIVFDTVQYMRHSWMNRNRIIHPSDKEWLYITAPVQKHEQGTIIQDINVLPGREWKDQILRQLTHYKKFAPHYEATLDMVQRALDIEEESLSKTNVHGLKTVCDYLGIDFSYRFFSEMDLPIGPIDEPGDWGLRIAEAFKADEYINPPGGASFMDPKKYKAHGVKLTIQKLVEYPYTPRRFTYVPGLSIIDVCMWNSPQEIKRFLDGYNYEAKAA